MKHQQWIILQLIKMGILDLELKKGKEPRVYPEPEIVVDDITKQPLEIAHIAKAALTIVNSAYVVGIFRDIFDGDDSTFYGLDRNVVGTTSITIKYDFDSIIKLHQVYALFTLQRTGAPDPATHIIDYSEDDSTWTTLSSETGGGASTTYEKTFQDITCRYLRIRMSGTSGAGQVISNTKVLSITKL